MRTLILTILLGFMAYGAVAAAADGELDPTFLTDVGFPGYGFYANPNAPATNAKDTIGAIVERPDHKIWAIGKMSTAGTDRLSLFLVQTDGVADVTFGVLGLRTVIQPCAGFEVADAKVDSKNRLLVAINGCVDFMVYRFLPNGDLDASFATGGVLSVAFNKGGDNEDQTRKLIIAPNGDVIIAGTVETATSRSLGVARYTQAGQAAAEFGVAGKVVIAFEWEVWDHRGVNGLHQMADGRILITGVILENPQGQVQKQQYVVRLLANGALDPSYGNSSAGISKVNHKLALGVNASPDTMASLMTNDGSIVQIGAINSTNVNSGTDIFLMRWQSDGQLDTSIGLNGTRQYALDYSGPNPPHPLFNYDSGRNIVQQDNGDYVILALSKDEDFVLTTTMMRLKRNFDVDTSFGIGGKKRYDVQIGNGPSQGQSGSALMLQTGRILFGGSVYTPPSGNIQMMMSVEHDEIFAHTFD